jgi:hypothetical protein
MCFGGQNVGTEPAGMLAAMTSFPVFPGCYILWIDHHWPRVDRMGADKTDVLAVISNSPGIQPSQWSAKWHQNYLRLELHRWADRCGVSSKPQGESKSFTRTGGSPRRVPVETMPATALMFDGRPVTPLYSGRPIPLRMVVTTPGSGVLCRLSADLSRGPRPRAGRE